MLQMTVTEIPRRLEPVTLDTFLTVTADPTPPVRAARLAAVERPPERA